MSRKYVRPPARVPQPASEGRLRAAHVGHGINDPQVMEILADFHRLNTDEARAAFADSWVRITSRNMDATWVVFYELLRLIRDHKLYESSEYMKGGKTFDSFRAYWEKAVQQPFTKWLELEETYHFVRENAPGLMEKTFPEAKEGVAELRSHGGDRKSEAFQEEREGNQGDCITLKRGTTGVPYLQARLKRSHPDIFARMESGEFKSTRAAAIAAGIVRPPTPLDLLKRAWLRASVEERKAFAEWTDRMLVSVGMTARGCDTIGREPRSASPEPEPQS